MKTESVVLLGSTNEYYLNQPRFHGNYNCFGYVLRRAGVTPKQMGDRPNYTQKELDQTMQAHGGFQHVPYPAKTPDQVKFGYKKRVQKAVVYTVIDRAGRHRVYHVAIQRLYDPLTGKKLYNPKTGLKLGKKVWWESKLGSGPLIAHDDLNLLVNNVDDGTAEYGNPRIVYERPWTNNPDLDGGPDAKRKWWPMHFTDYPK